MDMRFDQAGTDEPARQIHRLALGSKARPDVGDLAAHDADVGRLVFGADQPCVAQNEIHLRSSL